MLIALIDDGIIAEKCNNIRLEYDLVVGEDGVVHARPQGERILTDHGTTCAQIIHKYASSASFCSLRIFCGPTLKTSVTKLLAALQWCKERRIPIIHMSVGTTRLCDHRPIQKLIYDMLQQGQLIIAAHSNQWDRYTMPACYTGVLGVATDPALRGFDFHVMDVADSWGVQIPASSRHDLSEYPHGIRETLVSNSYAAPTVTAKVHEILSSKKDCILSPFAIYQELANRPVLTARMYPDFLTRAIVFDPEDQLKQTDCLAFDILGRYANTAAFLDAIRQNKKAPIILLPSSSCLTPDFMEAVCACSAERFGVVYAGTAPNDLRIKLPCVLWDEGICRFLCKRMKPEPVDPTIVMLCVEPQGEATLCLMRKMKKYLHEKGYGCLAISDFSRAYLYGLDYLPESCLFHVVRSCLCRVQRPDIVLYAVRDGADSVHENMRIRLDDRHAGMCSEKLAVLPTTPTDEDIQGFLSALIEK